MTEPWEDYTDPLDRFSNEVFDLIDRWRSKTADDKLSVAQIVGALHIAAHSVTAETLEEDE